MISIEALKVIIMACQLSVGSAVTNGLTHSQKEIAEKTLEVQRTCQRRMIACVGNDEKTLTRCLMRIE